MNDKARKSASGGQEAKRRNKADIQALERDYRTGKFTLRELEAKHGVNNGTIARWAAKNGWTQDLTDAIKQATNSRLIAAMVQQECSAAQQGAAETVLIAAEVNTQVIMGHRKGLNRLTRIKERLLDHIEQTVENLPDLAEVIEMVRNPDENGIDRANDALRKALGRSAAVDELKKLAEVDEKVRKGEREAFNISSDADELAGKPVKRVVLDFVDAVPK